MIAHTLRVTRLIQVEETSLQPLSNLLPMTTRLATGVFIALLLAPVCRFLPRTIQGLRSNPNRSNCHRQQKALLKLR